jgi:diadenosine tetraphosphate (Ap4A) HIT family hydrolase
MNPTMEKFGYPGTVLRELDHWAILLRPAQVTFGSLVLAAKSPATGYGDLLPEAFAEQGHAVALIERALRDISAFERINYLMLMMVDPNVHFHVIPRYSDVRRWNGIEFPDVAWPGPPQLGGAVQLSDVQFSDLVAELAPHFR